MRKSIIQLSIALSAFAFSLLVNTNLVAQCDSGTVKGIAYWDSNFNGSQESNESGLSGVIVKLYDSSGTLVGQTITTCLLYTSPSPRD